jgi:hypothetical protein
MRAARMTWLLRLFGIKPEPPKEPRTTGVYVLGELRDPDYELREWLEDDKIDGIEFVLRMDRDV